MGPIVHKPKHRSALRLYAEQKYYTLLRHAQWAFGGRQLAKRQPGVLAYPIFLHATPLFRKLKDVDMYLQQNKVVNLKLAAAKLSGVTLGPGESFSFWKLIGKPTKKKGYLKGMVLQNVRTQPFGSGATCFYNYGDLVLYNGTQQVFQLLLEVTDNELKGQWRTDRPCACTYEVYEKEHRMQQEHWGGYTRHNILYRRKLDLTGRLLDDEYVVENHAVMMYAPFLDAGRRE